MYKLKSKYRKGESVWSLNPSLESHEPFRVLKEYPTCYMEFVLYYCSPDRRHQADEERRVELVPFLSNKNLGGKRNVWVDRKGKINKEGYSVIYGEKGFLERALEHGMKIFGESTWEGLEENLEAYSNAKAAILEIMKDRPDDMSHKEWFQVVRDEGKVGTIADLQERINKTREDMQRLKLKTALIGGIGEDMLNEGEEEEDMIMRIGDE